MKHIISILFIALVSSVAHADYAAGRMYEVTVTNITKGQSFTPIISATHKSRIQFFELGNVASDAIATMAESGNIALLQADLEASGQTFDIASTSGLLMPGNTISWTVSGKRFAKFSFAAMLIPTNDTFVALDSVSLPRYGTKTYYAKAYDAGSEENDEYCVNIPGPVCGGEGLSEADGEGYIHISSGIHGVGDLASAAYDWRDAVAKVEIRRIR